MELLLIYLWLKATEIGVLFSAGGVVLFFIWGICWIVGKENRKPSVMKNWVGGLAIALFCIGFVSPSSKDIAILVGASIAIDVVKSPEGEKVQSLIRATANKMLDEELNKLKEQNK